MLFSNVGDAQGHIIYSMCPQKYTSTCMSNLHRLLVQVEILKTCMFVFQD